MTRRARLPRRALPAAAGLLLLAAACSSRPAGPSSHRSPRPPTPSASGVARPATCASEERTREVTLRSDGVRRTFRLATPRASSRLPLVVLFHGYGETAAFIDRYTALPRAATRLGFAVATPQGALDRWNFPRRPAIGSDDVGFFRVMLAWLRRHACVQRQAVFVTGFSDGADMADTVACVPGLGVRAVAGVAASVIPRPCAGPVDVLQLHGDRDPVVPFGGGGGDRPPPFEDTQPVAAVAQLRFWVRLDRCSGTTRTRLPHRRAVLVVGTRCRSGDHAELLVVRGSGHTWPGARAALPYGATSHTLSATHTVLYFFRTVSREW